MPYSLAAARTLDANSKTSSTANNAFQRSIDLCAGMQSPHSHLLQKQTDML